MTPCRAADSLARDPTGRNAANLLAAASARSGTGRGLLASFLRHELATSHVLMMRTAGEANGFITRIGSAPPGDEARVSREAVRLSGIVARLMERFRLGLLALPKLDASA